MHLPAFVCVLLFAVTASAQLSRLPNPLRRPPDSKSGASAELQELKRERYDNLLNFADGLYKQREAFRYAVDRQYEALLREHADRAFGVNTSPKSEIRIILEDRFRFFTGLYDNLLMQDLINRMGQAVVPDWADRLVTFKLIADPIPRAEAMATGTVYITTGLVAMLDNRAQLSYILAHEAGHVAADHWKTRIKIAHGKEEWAKQSQENQQSIERMGTFIGAGIGVAAGANISQTLRGATIGAAIGATAGYVTALAMANSRMNIDWNRLEEDDADKIALESMLRIKENVREVPNLYLNLDKVAMKDDRVGMGFWGSRTRMQERLKEVNDFIAAKVKDSTPLTGVDKQFIRLISELKRDNGILAFHYDMLDTARANLAQAVDTGNPDPAALYYYAKVLKATARTDSERAEADRRFQQTMQADRANHAYGAFLHSATALIDKNPGDKERIKEYLETYVARYGDSMEETSSRGSRNLPPHMDTILDYMRRVGITECKYCGKSVPQRTISAVPDNSESPPAVTQAPEVLPVKSRSEQRRPVVPKVK